MARARAGALQAGAAQLQVTAVPVGRLVVVQEGGPGAGAPVVVSFLGYRLGRDVDRCGHLLAQGFVHVL